MVGTEISDEDRDTEAALDVANGSSDDRAERYRRAKTGVTRFDGHFIVVVASTGIYCRPSCPATTPHPRNIDFLNCRPDFTAAPRPATSRNAGSYVT